MFSFFVCHFVALLFGMTTKQQWALRNWPRRSGTGELSCAIAARDAQLRLRLAQLQFGTRSCDPGRAVAVPARAIAIRDAQLRVRLAQLQFGTRSCDSG